MEVDNMTIEGIAGGMATYQAPVVKKAEAPVEPVKVNESYSSDDGVVSELSKEIRTVSDATDGNGGTAENESQQQKQPSNETMKQALSDINKRLMNNTECIFGVHEQTNRITIQIVDKDTKEVIKELPPEKTLDMIAKAWELAGILVDEKL
jgi:flagellar protein FlaG